MWLPFFLFCFPTFISIYSTNTDNEDLNSLALQLKDLEAAVDGEIHETKGLVNLIEKRSLSQRATSACDQVAFHAVLTTTSVSVSSNEVIKFNHIITNVGEGYNTSTGTFTAPVAGYYEFIVTIMAQSGNTFLSKVLINGSEVYCRAYGSSTGQSQGMCDLIYYLSQGSTANVTTASDSALYGDGFSSFSGHLIG